MQGLCARGDFGSEDEANFKGGRWTKLAALSRSRRGPADRGGQEPCARGWRVVCQGTFINRRWC